MISHHGTFTLVDKLEFKILHLHVTISFKKRFPKKPPDHLMEFQLEFNKKKCIHTSGGLFLHVLYTFFIIFRIDKTKVEISLI